MPIMTKTGDKDGGVKAGICRGFKLKVTTKGYGDDRDINGSPRCKKVADVQKG